MALDTPFATRPAVDDFFVPKEHYLSSEFARLEAEKLWPRVWQVACREEEIKESGDFVTYDILDESFVIMRTDDGSIRAFYNVCPHRGRPLTEGCGQLRQIVCRYHGWGWDIEGNNTNVVDIDDWAGRINAEQLKLKQAKVGTWGGFVFINMDHDCEPLESFLHPFTERCAKLEYENLRFDWYRTVEMPLNWKAVLEGFNEAYHVQTTHSQMLQYIEEYSNSEANGRHGAFWYPPLPDGIARFSPSRRLGKKSHGDYRQYVLAYYKEMREQLGGLITDRSYKAAQRLRDEVSADATSMEVMAALRRFQVEAAEADGAGWPDMTFEDVLSARSDWQIFPNVVVLHSGIDGVLCYRARPNGHDPDKCIFDVWSLVRFGPGLEPKLDREYFTDWRQCEWGRILTQDFINLEKIQRGMKSSAFHGGLTNPVQEKAIATTHYALRAFLGLPPIANGQGPSA